MKMENTLMQIQKESRISEVVRTLSGLCFSALSLDQRGQFNFMESAKYSSSFSSGQILDAFFRNSLNSDFGIILIFKKTNEIKISIFSNESSDFLDINFLYLFNSSNMYSGEYNSKRSENSILDVFPEGEINEEKTMFASMTSFIYFQEDDSLYFLCIPSLTFFPNSIANLFASSSVSLDSLTIELNKASCTTLFLIASLATSDQLMNFDFSISDFKSSGTDSVIVGIFGFIVYLFNIFNTLNIFKSFGEKIK